MNNSQSVNEGTNNKGKLQDIAIQCIGEYPPNQTLRIYAEYLSWDLKITVRTALESYIIPMMRRGYLVHLKSDTFTQASNNPQSNTTDKKETSTSKSTNKCRNCGNSIPDNTTFCNKDCVEQYKNESFAEYADKHPNENKKYENYVKDCITNKIKKLSFDEWNLRENNQ